MKIFVIWSRNDTNQWIKEYADGLMVPLSCISKSMMSKVTIYGLHRVLDFKKDIMVDSLTTTISRVHKSSCVKNQVYTASIQQWIGADYLVHKDYPLIDRHLSIKEKWKLLKLTLRNAEIMLKLQDKYDINNVIYVIQGWNLQSVEYCTSYYQKLGIEMYGLGSTINLSPNKLVKRVKKVREIIGNKAYLHIFGSLKLSSLPRIMKLVDSIDTSLPFKLAGKGYTLINVESRKLKRVKIDNISLEDLVVPQPLKEKLESVIQHQSLHHDRPPVTELKRVLAAINLYIIKQKISEYR